MLNFKSLGTAAALSIMFALPALAANHAVTISGMKFSPANFKVVVGDTITFTNMDSVPHTATAGDGSFDTGRITKGKSKKVTISVAGTHAYICTIHPSMKGKVTAK